MQERNDRIESDTIAKSEETLSKTSDLHQSEINKQIKINKVNKIGWWDIVEIVLIAVMLVGFALFEVLGTDDEISQSERRPLAQMPDTSIDALVSGEFMDNFESYTLDQFPLRDKFRTIKAMVSFNLMGKMDNNEIYIRENSAAKILYPIDKEQVDYATERIKYIYDKYFKDTPMSNRVYYSIIPDKSYFLAGKYGYPKIDYDKFKEDIGETIGSFASNVEIFDTLDISDYYNTDTHWRIERIYPTYKRLAESMGNEVTGNVEYYQKLESDQFNGVYYGQSALPLKADTIYSIGSNLVDTSKVYDYEKSKTIEMFDTTKLNDKDPYEMYNGGSTSLIKIEKAMKTSDKTLLLFRDSFGASIAPYFTECYDTIYLIDTRYIHPDMLGRIIKFSDLDKETDETDVLFMYSTTVLNSGKTLK